MLTVLLLLTCLYSLGVILITTGLFRLSSGGESARPSVSVIVAARNEAENVRPLLGALVQQDYPADNYEVILVDDGSTDGTADRVRLFSQKRQDRDIKLISAAERDKAASPKKNALKAGIEASSGEILLFTDADCLPPAGWISGMIKQFSTGVGMVIGFSPYESLARLTLFQKLVALDSLALAALAAATTGLGRPATCNGRNLAYRRDLWDQVGGFRDIEQFVSGDDDLFLKLILQKTKTNIRYAFHPQLVVPTRPLTSFQQFVNQRLRHASKGFFYSPKQVTALTLLYLYYLLLFIGVPAGVFFSDAWLVLLILAIKSAGEFLLLFLFSFKMNRTHFLKLFPLAVLLYTPYVVLFGLLGQFSRFSWKGQKSGTINGGGAVS